MAVAVSKPIDYKYRQNPPTIVCPSVLTAVGVDEELVLVDETIIATPT